MCKKSEPGVDDLYSFKSWGIFPTSVCLGPWISLRKHNPNSINKLFSVVYVYAFFCLLFSSCCELCHLLVLEFAFFRCSHYQLHQPCLQHYVNIKSTVENRTTIKKKKKKRGSEGNKCLIFFFKKKKKEMCVMDRVFEMPGDRSLHGLWWPYWWFVFKILAKNLKARPTKSEGINSVKNGGDEKRL